MQLQEAIFILAIGISVLITAFLYFILIFALVSRSLWFEALGAVVFVGFGSYVQGVGVGKLINFDAKRLFPKKYSKAKLNG